MTDIESIKQPITNELAEYNAVFDNAFKASDTLLKNVLVYVHQNSGKQLRPTLALLSAKLCGNVIENSYLAAAAFEILHTASLMHDDVVDETYERRGKKSANALFSNKAAVLVGDYLLTAAISLITRTRTFALQDCLTHLSTEIARGELLELEHVFSIPSEQAYYNIIKGKTAILFAVSAKSGAITAEAGEEKQNALKAFGMNVGMCFQIKDDIFDYTEDADIGKPVFNDIREGKVTLPLILSVEKASETERGKLVEMLATKDFGNENIDFAINLVKKYNGIETSIERMKNFRRKAVQALSIFPDSEEKEALLLMLDFAIERKK